MKDYASISLPISTSAIWNSLGESPPVITTPAMTIRSRLERDEGLEPVCSQYQCKCQRGDGDFTQSSGDERPDTLFRHFTKGGSQSHSREGEQKSPTREIGQVLLCWFGGSG
jgi:hypothetical protein